MSLSATKVDRLGRSLAQGALSEESIRLLHSYRQTFAGPYDHVVAALRRSTGLAVTGRPSKSTSSITDKLKRETIRLRQMQDIAGCRVVVPTISAQNTVLARLCTTFPGAKVIDRRERPSNGYRAIHLVVTDGGLPVEIQLRTNLQHRWAELSEKLSDIFGAELKYGGGPTPLRDLLLEVSGLIADQEKGELARPSLDALVLSLKKDLSKVRSDVATLRRLRPTPPRMAILELFKDRVANLKSLLAEAEVHQRKGRLMSSQYRREARQLLGEISRTPFRKFR